MDSYIGGIAYSELETIIQKLAPCCRICGGRKTRVCLQKCCQRNQVFCKQCSSEEHFLHLTNDIALMFIHNRHYTNEQHLIDSATRMKDSFTTLRHAVETIMSQCRELLQMYGRSIREIEDYIENIEEFRWHDKLYAIVEQFTKQVLTVEQARSHFQERLGKINLHRKSWQSGKDSNARRQITENICKGSSYLVAENEAIAKCLSSLESETGIEVILKKYPLEKFIAVSPVRDPSIVNARNRARVMGGIEEFFYGDRLMLLRDTRKRGIHYPVGQELTYPFLTELHTDYELNSAPRVQSLGLSFSLSWNLDILDCVSDTLEVLRLHIQPGSRELSEEETQSCITPIIDRVVALPRLQYLYISLPDIMAEDVQRLIQYARAKGLRNCCFRVSRSSEEWVPRFETRYACSCFEPVVQASNRVYQRKLKQVMAVQKCRFLRNTARIFKERILEFAEHPHEIEPVLPEH